MPTSNPQIKLTVTHGELAQLRARSIDGESDSNLIRRLLKLKPLKQGARLGNKNAVRANDLKCFDAANHRQ